MSVLKTLCAVHFSLLLFSVRAVSGQMPPFQTAIYEMRVIEEKEGRTTEGLSKVWVDFTEQKYTTETEVTGPDGKSAKYITILSEGKVYILNVEAKTAQEIPHAEGGNALIDWTKPPDYKRFGGVVVGTDTIAGRETDIFEYMKFEERIRGSQGEERGREIGEKGEDGLQEIIGTSALQVKVRQWIWKGTDFPLKTILDYGSKRNITETLHIAVNVDIPERVFKIPKEYSVIQSAPYGP